jgi:drug/metabolite transporter (DMT)-like permease
VSRRPDPEESNHPVTTALPVLLALVSACCYATAAVLQRLETDRGGASATGRSFLRGLLRRPLWWVALAVLGLGAAVHVVALGVGPVAVVQPIGVLALVLALPIDARVRRRRVAWREWSGAGLVVVGLVAVLAALRHSRRPPAPGLVPFVITVALVLGVVGVLLAAGARPRLRSRGVITAVGAGACMGTASVAVHVAIGGLTGSGQRDLAVGGAALAAALILPVLGLGAQQFAYRDGGLDGPLAALTITDPLTAGLIGLTLLQERPPVGPTLVVLAVLGTATAVAGLIFLARTPDPDRNGPDPIPAAARSKAGPGR